MAEINAKYELLFEDLKELGIGDFLTSRKFKYLMTKYKQIETWRKTLNQVEKSRTWFSPDTDHVYFDSLDTLATYFNAISHNKNVEQLIAIITAEFISNMEFKIECGSLVESLEISEFDKGNIEHIQKAISINEKLPDKEDNTPVQEKPPSDQVIYELNKVFIVHGHNNEFKLEVARTLESLGIQAIILHEQSNSGQTVIEKLEKHSDVQFAVVLLTSDDHGCAKTKKELQKRARQNVVLELGYFLAKLGRSNVLPLLEQGVEIPSDMAGIVYTPLDSTGNWKYKMGNELKAAGFEVDLNKIK